MTGLVHTPDRPSWACRACGRDWPCDPAREQLVATMDAAMLTSHMATLLTLAAAENRLVPAEELFERFIAWTKRPRAVLQPARRPPANERQRAIGIARVQHNGRWKPRDV